LQGDSFKQLFYSRSYKYPKLMRDKDWKVCCSTLIIKVKTPFCACRREIDPLFDRRVSVVVEKGIKKRPNFLWRREEK